MTTIVIPWLLDLSGRYPWQSMAWGFTIICPTASCSSPETLRVQHAWHEKPKRTSAVSYPRGIVDQAGAANHSGDHSHHYPGFPALVARPP